MTAVEARSTTPGVAVASDLRPSRYWWLFLITGILWLLASIVIFRFDATSVTAVGAIAGVVCIAAGFNELMAIGASTGGWKVFRGVLGAICLIVGMVALLYPDRTFAAVAAIFSFFLLFKGTFDIVVALTTRHETDLWWLGLIAGIFQVLLAFWAAGAFGREAVLLIVWVAASALIRGVTEIVLAFRLRAEG
ncbi:MAG TPA: DUF308 domain-containing protein [Solirubrobacter sp.]|jgi:uncharacterized membrane protein HdeD (DUF308 family)|nr:DUF308 domain-containing protein [Solirubrobacter sp.]